MVWSGRLRGGNGHRNRILSTKISYLLYPYLKQKIFHGNVQDVIVSPGYQNGRINLNFIKRF